MKQDHPIAVMDGTCALCSWGARMIHRLDRSGTIRICPIQTERGAALMRAYGLDALDPESWLFIEGDTVWRDFDALIRVGERSGGFGWAFSLLRIIPSPMRDRFYAWVARNRYRMFGKGDMCAIPDAAFRARLMS